MLRRLVLLLGLACALSPPSPARARIALEPLREVLRGSNNDLRACRERFSLPDGRYAVRIVIDALGKVTESSVVDSPERLDPAPRSCVEAAFSRLRFPARRVASARGGAGDGTTAPRPPGRAIPPALGTARVSGPGLGPVVIQWPFVLSSG